jgi:hypothetical protein
MADSLSNYITNVTVRIARTLLHAFVPSHGASNSDIEKLPIGILPSIANPLRHIQS